MLCWYYNRIRWELNNTLDCYNISTITLDFMKLFSKAKNWNVHLKIWTKETITKREYINGDMWESEIETQELKQTLSQCGLKSRFDAKANSWWSNWYKILITNNCHRYFSQICSWILFTTTCITLYATNTVWDKHWLLQFWVIYISICIYMYKCAPCICIYIYMHHVSVWFLVLKHFDINLLSFQLFHANEWL